MIMAETAEQLVNMIQARVKNRVQALNALSMSTMDLSAIPDDVKMMREIEAAKIRAVMEEQTDLIEIIHMLFPKPKAVKIKEKKPVAIKSETKK